MHKLQVTGRYLSYDDGSPFFYLGDTAWELFHRFDRDEIEHYFTEREKQGFNVAQCVALAEFEGVTVPNKYDRLPLKFTNGLPDPLLPDTDGDYSYWAHVDYAVECAAKHNIFITLLPTWGDKFNICWGKGPEIFTAENAYSYGKWIASRYASCDNIIWMLGGDRPIEENHRLIIDAMAKGILEADKNHLITFHPTGNHQSTECVGDAPYIDFHTSQTGHGIEQCYESDSVMLKMRADSDKPYMDSEPRYEDHPSCFDVNSGILWNASDVRQNAYWNLLSGVCGHTYGNHNIWGANDKEQPYFPFLWKDALVHEGVNQMKYMKKLRESRDYYSLEPCHDIVKTELHGMGHMTSARGDGYAFVYSPLGIPFTISLDVFTGCKYVKGSWFDPRTGEEKQFTVLPPQGLMTLAPPSQGKGCDWILILDAVK